jgi:hypothetical protein
MRIPRPLVFAGLAIAGATAVAAAELPKVHVLTVHLPGGGVEQIHYVGDTPPQVMVREAAPVAAMPVSLFDAAVGGDSLFAQMDRVAAEMDAHADAMMRQAAMMAAQPQQNDAVQMTALANAPAGAHYSYVSTTMVNGKSCTTSVSMTSAGAGKAPQMLRQVSGDCATAVQRPTTPQLTAAPAAPAPVAKPVLTSAPAPAKAAKVSPDSI